MKIFFRFTLPLVAAILLMSQTGIPANTQNAVKQSAQRGQEVYRLQCLACHQADGGGVQNMNPTLIKTKWVLGDKVKLITIVLNGLKGGEIEIDGDIFHNVMAPHKDLSDQQIADVLTYIRSSFGNKAKPVTPAEVKAVRNGAQKI